MHMFTFGGLTFSSADHMSLGWFLLSEAGRGKVGAWGPTGLCVPCWLGPPCKVKSNRFAVSRGHEGLDLFVVS